LIENQTEQKMKVLRSDNGGEYTSKEFKDYLASKGIKHQLSIPRRPEQNEIAKRMNRTLTEHARSIRLQIDMSKEFWAEAVNHASYLVNMSLSTAIDLQIPEEMWPRRVCGLFKLTDFRLPGV